MDGKRNDRNGSLTPSPLVCQELTFTGLAMGTVILPRGLISLRIPVISVIPQDVHHLSELLPPWLPHLHTSRPARSQMDFRP
jgi:hypothetical protein